MAGRLLILTFVFIVILSGVRSHAQEAVESRQFLRVTENNTFIELDGVAQYKIGIGDILEIDLLVGISREKFTPEVRPNGFITLPFLDVKVAGLTTTQAEERIKEELGRYVKAPRVEVRVKEYRSKKVVVLGTAKPGVYYLKGKTTLLELITELGGIPPNTAMDRIQLRRADGSTIHINLLKVIGGAITENIILDAGDEIYIPAFDVAENKILVFGEVKKPGLYPRRPGLTLLDAIGMADGYTIYAVLSNTAVIRTVNPQTEVIVANLKRLIKKGDISQNILLANNDVIYVPRSKIGDWNVFIQKIKPTFELLALPLSTVITIRALED